MLLPLIPNHSILGGLTIAFSLLLIPATQGAVDLVNNTVSSRLQARALPKLDFSDGIPAEFTTLVAVPTLLLNENQVRELLQDLEVALSGQSGSEPALRPAHRSARLRSLARGRTTPTLSSSSRFASSTNSTRATKISTSCGRFFFLHRHRIFNARQGVWMGWERKRGKLLDLNKLLKGDFDAFPVKAGRSRRPSPACAICHHARLRYATAAGLGRTL